MKKTYYLIIAVILAIIAILSLLSYSSLEVLFVKYFDSNSINVFFISRNGKLIQNVSVSLFAFYPTSRGTVIRKIYQGSDLKFLSIPLSNLTWYADQWLKTYNYIALKPMVNGFARQTVKYYASAITPSLIGFASYYVVNKNGTITIYSQPFTVSVSPQNITQGIGKTVFKVFADPIVKVAKIPLRNITPQQTTITTTVPHTTSPPSSYPRIYTCYVLDTYWVYPYNNSELGPIPLAVAYVTDPNANDYSGYLCMSESAYSSSGYAISFGISLLASVANIKIFGSSITLHSGSASASTEAHFGYYGKHQYTNFAEIYTYGQIAIANLTEYQVIEYCGYVKQDLGNVTMFFITALEVNGNNGTYVPALYVTNYPFGLISSYFTGKLNYTGRNAPPHSTNGVAKSTIYVSTSERFASGGISLAAILAIARALDASVPWWVPLLPLPYISIVPFSSIPSDYIVAVGIYSNSANTYYIYYEETNVSYNIEGNYYTIPTYYFYVNYTTS